MALWLIPDPPNFRVVFNKITSEVQGLEVTPMDLDPPRDPLLAARTPVRKNGQKIRGMVYSPKNTGINAPILLKTPGLVIFLSESATPLTVSKMLTHQHLNT